MDRRRGLGAWGEDLAEKHLRAAGYTILERNVRSRYGEIDIVARDHGCIVFVEVRTRQSRAFTPEESVTTTKRRRVAALGARYMAERGLADAEWRGDMIAVEQDVHGALIRLEHYVSAIEEPSE
ncbi:MAG: YraN family protein [Chloroflexi bacterium]|nr:YraN family protein [Chloroflexota bacterium]